MTTHAAQEHQLLTYFEAYRPTINLAKFAAAAEVPLQSLNFFLDGERGLSPTVLAKCLAYLKRQAQALQVFA